MDRGTRFLSHNSVPLSALYGGSLELGQTVLETLQYVTMAIGCFTVRIWHISGSEAT